jgi:hypothetical protein
MKGAQVTKSSRKRGCTLIICPKVGFILCIMIFNGLLARFGRFDPFLEELGPFLKPDLGGKLGVFYQLQAYINQRLLKP